MREPRLEAELPGLPEDRSEEARLELAALGRADLYFLLKSILGYRKLTPSTHGPLCRFLQFCPMIRRMVQMPRSTFKTTCGAIGHTMWLVINDPNIRILLTSGTSSIAERIMLEIRNHFERNELFRWLYPEILPETFKKARWNNQELEVRRAATWREPTIDARSAGSMIESNHYDWIKADDIIGEAEYNSDLEMDRRTTWALGMESLLINPKCNIDVYCTRWKGGDTYEKLDRNWSPLTPMNAELGPFAVARSDKFALFHRHAIEDNESIFPEEIPFEWLLEFRQRNPDRFAAWYANNPRESGTNLFHQEWWRNARLLPDGRVELAHDGKLFGRLDPSSLDRVVVFDPAVSKKKRAARNAIHVVAKGEVRNPNNGDTEPALIVLESRVRKMNPSEAVDTMFELDTKWLPDAFSIESVAYQGAIRFWLAERADRDFLPLPPIVEYMPRDREKDERIRALQPFFRAGYIWVVQPALELQDEYETYPGSEYRDALDALAQVLDYWPMLSDAQSAATDRRLEEARLRKAGIASASPARADEESDEVDFDSLLDNLDASGYGFREYVH